MIFEYQAVETCSPETGIPDVTLRPMILIRIAGLSGGEQFPALVDTGADCTIFPKSFAEFYGVVTVPGNGPAINVLGGQTLFTEFGDVQLELQQGSDTARWPARVQFYKYASADEEEFILGHAGFLDYFTATFDGQEGRLTLIPNDDLPKIP